MAPSNRYNVVVYPNEQYSIQLLYDTWHFRPHIIVQLRQPKSYILPHELREAYKLIGEFLQAKPEFDNQVSLCFRQGAWIRPRISTWQARLYVPKEVYKQNAKLAIRVSEFLCLKDRLEKKDFIF